MKSFFSLFFVIFCCSGPALAYPEFQRYSKSVSGRPVNCALCHFHSDGPEGLKPGQIGSLEPEELNALGLARQAFKPGSGIKNPILNEFGNAILEELGKEKIVALKQNPELLASVLSKSGDLDGDGISNVAEFLDGTHPLNALDGRPEKLFRNNLRQNWFHIVMIGLATALGLWGLHNALLGLSLKSQRKE